MMKKLFMIEFDLPEEMSDTFMQRIPAQRAMVNKMLADGRIKNYSLAMDRSRLWLTMVADNEFEVMEAIARFPLIDYMEPYVSELAFYNSEEQVMQFSLN